MNNWKPPPGPWDPGKPCCGSAGAHVRQHYFSRSPPCSPGSLAPVADHHHRSHRPILYSLLDQQEIDLALCVTNHLPEAPTTAGF